MPEIFYKNWWFWATKGDKKYRWSRNLRNKIIEKLIEWGQQEIPKFDFQDQKELWRFTEENR